MTRAEIVSKARKAPALRKVPVAAVRALVAKGRALDAEQGTVLFEEGEAGDRVFLVLRGTVRVSKDLGEGRSALVALRGGGDWIGEMSLRPGEARSATATVDGKARLLEIPTRDFAALLRAHPAGALDLLGLVSERLRESDRGMVDALRKRTDELLVANERLGEQMRRIRAGEDSERGLDAFVGRSAHADRIRKAGVRAARRDTGVLLVGEPGVGKTLLARCIHEASERGEGPFEVLDCSVFESPVLETEIFGHARGALPGLRTAAPGAIERADGGTLYLDRVDALAGPLQGMLYRFLELGEIQRVGESRVRSADVRVLASLAERPKAGSGGLRDDLLARLAVMTIELPPLRKRRNDIALLAARLSERCAAERGVAPLELTPSALRVLSLYDFPENALELRGELEALYEVAEPGSRVTSRELSGKFIQGDPVIAEHYSEAVRAFKAQLITTAVSESAGHRGRAAKRLGLHPSNLSRMIRDLELDEVL